MRQLKGLSTLEKSSLILAGALLICLLPLPYGFYTIIRLATAIIAGCWAYKFFQNGKTTYAVISCAIVLLFQPFFKIVLDRLTWNVVDIIVAVIIVCLVFPQKVIPQLSNI
ncbi:MAG: hypothetical protein NC453_11045 [Muribaculum sp.]|nr:hypothetical protein [Muribaculum sp.]